MIVSFPGIRTVRMKLNTDILPFEKLPPGPEAIVVTRNDTIQTRAGDTVLTGQRLSDDLVSPLTGNVTALEKILDPSGKPVTLVRITRAAQEIMVSSLGPVADISSKSSKELITLLQDLGFSGIGSLKSETVIINTLDADPAILVNLQSFRETIGTIREYIDFAKVISGARRIIIAVPRGIQCLAQEKCGDRAEIRAIDPVYPNGHKEIISKKCVPGVPGTAVIGMEKLRALATAVKFGKPRQERPLTLIAPGVRKNLLVRVGTPLSYILKNYQITLHANQKLVLNGIMRGTPQYSTDFPVTNSLHGIYVQDDTEVFLFKDTPCINCGRCSSVCPVNLRVHMICRNAEYEIFESCRQQNIAACIECGLCTYVCPAHRPLNQLLRFAKASMEKEDAKE
jgi:electron transport complex protein RnfC